MVKSTKHESLPTYEHYMKTSSFRAEHEILHNSSANVSHRNQTSFSVLKSYQSLNLFHFWVTTYHFAIIPKEPHMSALRRGKCFYLHEALHRMTVGGVESLEWCMAAQTTRGVMLFIRRQLNATVRDAWGMILLTGWIALFGWAMLQWAK